MPQAEFPQELIDRVIDEVALQADTALHVSRELQSCSLTSRSFYYHCRKLRFFRTTVVVFNGEQESQALKNLRQILEENVNLRLEIHRFRIEYTDNPRKPVTDLDPSVSYTLCDIHLPHILRMLRELRGLSIYCDSELGALKWQRIDDATRSAFWNLQQTSCLGSLNFFFIAEIPATFIYKFKNLKVLSLIRASVVDVPDSVLLPSENPPLAPLTGSLPQLDVLRLTGTDFLFPSILRRPEMLSRLRTFEVDVWFGFGSDLEVVWDVLKKASKTLECLQIKNVFNARSSSPEVMTIEDFPELRTVKISSEDFKKLANDLLRQITTFLTPKTQRTTKLQSIEIKLTWFIHDDENQLVIGQMLRADAGWSELDNVCSNPRYPSLLELDINIVFSYPNRFFPGEEDLLIQVARRYSASTLLPLTSTLGSIAIGLHITPRPRLR